MLPSVRNCVWFTIITCLVASTPLGCATTEPEPTTAAPKARAVEEAPEKVAQDAPVLLPEGLEVKPVGLNKVVSTLRGCLAPTNRGRKPDVQLPPRRRDNEPMPQLLVEAYDWGMSIRHDLRHPCCLTGDMDTVVEGNRIVVTERLNGTPCNCFCWSVLITRIGLPAGDYELIVEQIGVAKEETLLFTTLEVGAANH